MTPGRVGVFLDRDGTINEEIGFLKTPDELALIPGAAASIRTLNERGYATCVISNQSGVARGIVAEEALVQIHARMHEQLRSEGARIDRVFYCPHHPREGLPPYNVVCSCRKPLPGMLLQGARELDIDLSRSFTVGDRIVDVQAGHAAGTRSLLVLTGYGRETVEECRLAGVHPDAVFPDLAAATAYIVQCATS